MVAYLLNILLEGVEWIGKNADLLAILIGPIVAVWVGELLRERNHIKQQKEDLLRRLIHYRYQLSAAYPKRDEIVGALNEITYWYYQDDEVKKKISHVWAAMRNSQDAQNLLLDLIQTVYRKEGRSISKEEFERTFQ